MRISPEQCRAARALLGMSQELLAKLAGVGVQTVIGFENSTRVARPSTLDAIRQALEAAGAVFIAENGEGPGVRLRKPRSE